MSELLSLKYQGFHPAGFTERFITKRMQELLKEAPAGAVLSATFTRKNHSFKGVMTITSSAGKFFAMASHTRFREVNRRLFEQMRQQFEKWKSRKFQHEGLKHIPMNHNNLHGPQFR